MIIFYCIYERVLTRECYPLRLFPVCEKKNRSWIVVAEIFNSLDCLCVKNDV